MNTEEEFEQSHKFAIAIITGAHQAGFNLETVIRAILPTLTLGRLEKIMTLLRQVIASKVETKTRLEAERNTTKWEVSS